jgi:hypothetical protein
MTFATSFKGKAGLVVAVGVVVILLIVFPAYRWLFAISLGLSLVLGILVAAILFLWHTLHPIRAEDVDDKRPLKLD